MASANDLLVKQRSVTEFLTAEGCSAVNIHQRMKSVYGDSCISDGVVRKWVRFFKGEDPEETIVRDRKRPGRPVSATDTTRQQQVDDMIRTNRRVKQKDIATELGISTISSHFTLVIERSQRDGYRDS